MPCTFSPELPTTPERMASTGARRRFARRPGARCCQPASPVKPPWPRSRQTIETGAFAAQHQPRHAHEQQQAAAIKPRREPLVALANSLTAARSFPSCSLFDSPPAVVKGLLRPSVVELRQRRAESCDPPSVPPARRSAWPDNYPPRNNGSVCRAAPRISSGFTKQFTLSARAAKRGIVLVRPEFVQQHGPARLIVTQIGLWEHFTPRSLRSVKGDRFQRALQFDTSVT